MHHVQTRTAGERDDLDTYTHERLHDPGKVRRRPVRSRNSAAGRAKRLRNSAARRPPKQNRHAAPDSKRGVKNRRDCDILKTCFYQ